MAQNSHTNTSLAMDRGELLTSLEKTPLPRPGNQSDQGKKYLFCLYYSDCFLQLLDAILDLLYPLLTQWFHFIYT